MGKIDTNHLDSLIFLLPVQKLWRKRRKIRRKHSITREFLTIGAVIVDHIRTDENLKNSLMKGMAREKVLKTLEGTRKEKKPEKWIMCEKTQPIGWRSQKIGSKGNKWSQVIWNESWKQIRRFPSYDLGSQHDIQMRMKKFNCVLNEIYTYVKWTT